MKNKVRIIKCPEFSIEWTMIYQYKKSEIGNNSPDNSQSGGSEKVCRDYILLDDVYAPKEKCIAVI